MREQGVMFPDDDPAFAKEPTQTLPQIADNDSPVEQNPSSPTAFVFSGQPVSERQAQLYEDEIESSIANAKGIEPPESIDPVQDGVEQLESMPVDSGAVKSFRDTLAGIESDQGAYAPALPELLISLGQALQQQGRYKEAADVFKRGVHLARINNGLHSAEQIPFIQGEINSSLAAGDLIEADQRQEYLLTVQQRSLASGEVYVQAMMQQASWQYSAYKRGIGENERHFSRLLRMLDLYRLVINDILEREGDSSPKLLQPLREMLRAQYLMSTYRDGSGMNADSNAASDRFRFNSYRMQNFKRGNSVILAIYKLQQKLFGEHALPATETIVMLGDWMLWHDKRDSAIKAYQDALRELAELDDAQVQIKNLFGEPVALPDIDGIRPLPPLASEEQGDILLEFGISTRGRIVELVRLNVDENEDVDFKGKAHRLMRNLRKTKFRPRFADGEPTVTEKIVRAYDFER